MNRFQACAASALALLLLTAFSGCAAEPLELSSVEPVTTTGTEPVILQTQQVIVTTTTEPPIPPDISVKMLAVGDNLVQTGVYREAQAQSADGQGYNFKPLYENLREYVEAADVAVINQETLICGGDYEITGSKLNFNSPVELGDAMVDLGFDVFTMANNHMLDKGIDGLASSMDYWDGMMKKYPILALGAYRNADDQSKIRMQEVNGMKIAYLSYAEHLNGYRIPDDSEIKIGMTADEELIERQIKAANETADAVVVAAHWGWEDTNEVDPAVKELAAKMVNWGADVILGSHSHTAETMEFIDRPDGTRGMVFYSMGNFISAQTDNFNMVGEMNTFTLVKHGATGETTVEDVRCMPVITHYGANFSGLKLYSYEQYTEELANSHALPYTHAYPERAKDFGMGVIDRIIEENIPEQFRWDHEPGETSGEDAETDDGETTTEPVTE